MKNFKIVFVRKIITICLKRQIVLSIYKQFFFVEIISYIIL